MNPKTRLGLILAVVVLPSSVGGVAQAAGEDFVEQLSFSGDFSKMLPGSEAARTYRVTNRSDEPVQLHLQVTNVSNDDNGCVTAETQAGDVTCGSGGGELLPWLDITVLAEDDQTLWSGSMQELETGAVLKGLEPTANEQLQIVTGLRLEAGNDTMSDQVGYDLEWTMRTAYGHTLSSTDIRLSAGSAGGESDFFETLARNLGTPRTHMLSLGLLSLFMVALLRRSLGCPISPERSERHSLR